MFFPFLFNRLHEQLQSFVEKKKLLFQVVKEREVGVAHRLLLLSHFHLVQRVPFVQNRPHFNLSDDCCLILSLFAVGVLAAVFFPAVWFHLSQAVWQLCAQVQLAVVA